MRARPHARLMPLGKRDDLLPSLITIDFRSRDKDGALSTIKRVGELRQRLRIGAKRAADVALRDGRGDLIPIIDGDRQEYGPARRLHRDVVSARERLRHIRGARWFVCPFHVRLRKFHRLLRKKEWVKWQDRARLLPRRDDQRRRVAEGRG